MSTTPLKPLAPVLVGQWHPSKNGTFQPEQASAGSGKKVWWQCEAGHEWEATIGSRTQGNKCPYCSGLKPVAGANDLGTLEPLIASQWHTTKNEGCLPSQITARSSKKVWWQCEAGHEWEATISARTSGARSGCPYCSGRRAIPGVNDFATHHPALALQWHLTKNKNLAPQQVTKSSGKKAWWLGECGHEWEAVIASRASGGGCPYCGTGLLLTGFNDLQTKEPAVAAQWHPSKNGDLLRSQITSRSGKKVWWLGECGHEWEQKISNRTALQQGCPYCVGQKVFSGQNDFASCYPELAKEWHPTKNGTLTPQQVSRKSSQRAWWLGECGHEWKSLIYEKPRNGCPVCANKLVIAGVNDLATLVPLIASQWHPSKNGPKLSTEVSVGSDYPAWWLCSKGHEWQASVYRRTAKLNSTGCPTCWAKSFVSKAEQAIFDYVASLGLQAEQSNRTVLGKRRELDIYVPEKKLAIEFNGLYWHSEGAGKDKSYHHDKWKACKDKGIQLIQIWEDEWNRNPEQVKQMLAHKLGVSSQEKVFARKTVVAEVSKKEAETFLHANHIQGYASGSYYLGLKRKENDELVSLIVLKKEAGTCGKTLNIIRYATAANVVGGFTKLMKHAERFYKPDAFITFADHCVSDGGLYENNGFIVDKELAPDYMYIVDGERKHKFGYRLKRFQSDSGLEYVDGLTERELAALNGLERVWDAGKTRYRKTM